MVRLADRPAAGVVGATPSLSPGVQRSDEVVPAVAGDDAAHHAADHTTHDTAYDAADHFTPAGIDRLQ